MAFEERNGNSYYYRKKRIGNRVVSEYIGKGELALMLYQMDKSKRKERESNAKKERRNREKIEEFDRDLFEIESKIKSLVEIFLINKGFHKTKSREWRLKNGSIN